MTPRFSIEPDEARPPFVVALDVGSGGTRAGVYDASGREIAHRTAKVLHRFTVDDDGTSIIDADSIVEELRTVLHGVLDEPLNGPVLAVGFDTFASSLVVVDRAGTAITPCITYADTRSSAHADDLSDRLDVRALHDRTGARIHTSYTAPRIAWLRDEHPDVFARASQFMALGEFVAFKLLGIPALGTAAAAWSGMLDRRTGEYVPELLDAIGIDANMLGRPRDPADTIPVAGTPLAREIPQLRDAVWVPVVGDGLAANLGIGAVGPSTWGISTATSGAIRQLVEGETPTLPGGLWAYRLDARRTLVGSAMSDCGRVLDWARSELNLPRDLRTIAASNLLTAPPDPTTPLVIPFFSGERGTKWRGGARALIANVSAATIAEDMLRGALEGVALSFLRIADQLKTIGDEPAQIMLSGGMTKAVPSWLPILADALVAPINHVATSRSTMRGSAVLALEQVASGPDIAAPPVLTRVEPVAAHADYYRERLERFERLADLA